MASLPELPTVPVSGVRVPQPVGTSGQDSRQLVPSSPVENAPSKATVKKAVDEFSKSIQHEIENLIDGITAAAITSGLTVVVLSKRKNSTTSALRRILAVLRDSLDDIRMHEHYVWFVQWEGSAMMKAIEDVEEAATKLGNWEIELQVELVRHGVGQDSAIPGVPVPDLPVFDGFDSEDDVFSFLEVFDMGCGNLVAKDTAAAMLYTTCLSSTVRALCKNQEGDLEALKAQLIKYYGDPSIMIQQRLCRIEEACRGKKDTLQFWTTLHNKLASIQATIRRHGEKHPQLEMSLYHDSTMAVLRGLLPDE